MHFVPASTESKKLAEYNEADFACQYFFSISAKIFFLKEHLIFLVKHSQIQNHKKAIYLFACGFSQTLN